MPVSGEKGSAAATKGRALSHSLRLPAGACRGGAGASLRNLWHLVSNPKHGQGQLWQDE